MGLFQTHCRSAEKDGGAMKCTDESDLRYKPLGGGMNFLRSIGRALLV